MKSGKAALKNGHPRITGCDNLTKDALTEGYSMEDSKQRFSKGFLCDVFFLELQLICHWMECVTKINTLRFLDNFDGFTLDFGMLKFTKIIYVCFS